MLKKFLFIILVALSFIASAQSIQTYTASESPKVKTIEFVTTNSVPLENQMENFFGFVIAGVVLAFGGAAFAAFALQNKEVLEE